MSDIYGEGHDWTVQIHVPSILIARAIEVLEGHATKAQRDQVLHELYFAQVIGSFVFVPAAQLRDEIDELGDQVGRVRRWRKRGRA